MGENEGFDSLMQVVYLLRFCCFTNSIVPSFYIREEAAIKQLLTVTKDTRVGGPAEGAHLHVVHLSDAGTSLELLKVHCQIILTDCLLTVMVKT